jgi:hypothetical protein
LRWQFQGNRPVSRVNISGFLVWTTNESDAKRLFRSNLVKKHVFGAFRQAA